MTNIARTPGPGLGENQQETLFRAHKAAAPGVQPLLPAALQLARAGRSPRAYPRRLPRGAHPSRQLR